MKIIRIKEDTRDTLEEKRVADLGNSWGLYQDSKNPLSLLYSKDSNGLEVTIGLEDRNGFKVKYTPPFNSKEDGEEKFFQRFEDAMNYARDKRATSFSPKMLDAAMTAILAIIRDKNYKQELFIKVAQDFNRYK